jgi:hypothetical protein
MRVTRKAQAAQFAAFAIQHSDLIAAGVDQFLPLEALQRLGDTSPPDAEHKSQELAGERQRVVANAIMGHQKPTRQTLINAGTGIGNGRVRRVP